MRETLLSCAAALHVDASERTAERGLVYKVAARDPANGIQLRK